MLLYTERERERQNRMRKTTTIGYSEVNGIDKGK